MAISVKCNPFYADPRSDLRPSDFPTREAYERHMKDQQMLQQEYAQQSAERKKRDAHIKARKRGLIILTNA